MKCQKCKEHGKEVEAEYICTTGKRISYYCEGCMEWLKIMFDGCQGLTVGVEKIPERNQS